MCNLSPKDIGPVSLHPDPGLLMGEVCLKIKHVRVVGLHFVDFKVPLLQRFHDSCNLFLQSSLNTEVDVAVVNSNSCTGDLRIGRGMIE